MYTCHLELAELERKLGESNSERAVLELKLGESNRERAELERKLGESNSERAELTRRLDEAKQERYVASLFPPPAVASTAASTAASATIAAQTAADNAFDIAATLCAVANANAVRHAAKKSAAIASDNAADAVQKASLSSATKAKKDWVVIAENKPCGGFTQTHTPRKAAVRKPTATAQQHRTPRSNAWVTHVLPMSPKDTTLSFNSLIYQVAMPLQKEYTSATIAVNNIDNPTITIRSKDRTVVKEIVKKIRERNQRPDTRVVGAAPSNSFEKNARRHARRSERRHQAAVSQC